MAGAEQEEREELGRLEEELGRLEEELDRLGVELEREELDRLDEELGLPVVRGDIRDDDPELPKPVLVPPPPPLPPLPDNR